MAEFTKSALFLDYEGLQRAMSGGERTNDTRLADRAPAWLAAIESGRLIGPKGTRRQLLIKRCYAGPSVRGRQRDLLVSAGFEVIDCGAGESARSSADLHMAMDTVEALARPNGPEEFIVLGGGSDLTPLLTRLRSAKRAVAIYVGGSTPASERSLADAALDGAGFAAFLAADEPPPAKSAGSASIDRSEIEAFARRIHAATNIPLFSPRTFAELFRALTEEIHQNGYHFQMTAKNVADRLTAEGRNVARRQVVFIVKGLALKGHVFSTDDTPERLAEVFRDQAQYLITNAGISLDENQSRLLTAWFTSRPSAPPAAEDSADDKPAAVKAEAPKPKPEAPKQTAEAPQPKAEPARTAPEKPPQAQSTPPRKPEIQPEPETLSEVEPELEAEPPKRPAAPPQDRTRPVAPRPTASARPPAAKPADLPKPAAKPAPPPKLDSREETRAAITARIAASAKLKPGARSPMAKPQPARPVQKDRPVQARPNPPAPTPRRAPPPATPARAPDALEDSILAAIAEAVDVLVEDRGNAHESAAGNATRESPPANNHARAAPEPEPAPEPAPEPIDDTDGDSDDIGDQIQRIIASYNRNRSEP